MKGIRVGGGGGEEKVGESIGGGRGEEWRKRKGGKS